MWQTKWFRTLVLGGAVCSAGAAVAQAVNSGAVQSAYASHRRAGITYRILLARSGNRIPVSTSFPFMDGDHVSLQLEVNRRSYVYVLNRTLQGDPEVMASRSMRLDAEEDAKMQGSSTPYTLLFPEAGSQYTVEPGRLQDVPPRGKTMTMVSPAGVEKLLVIVSPHPLDISTMFDPQTGQISRRADGAAAQRMDSDADVLNKLNARLVAMEDNVDQARDIEIVPGTAPAPVHPTAPVPPTGPSPQPPAPAPPVGKTSQPVRVKDTLGAAKQSIGVAKQSDKPILIEIALKHGGF